MTPNKEKAPPAGDALSQAVVFAGQAIDRREITDTLNEVQAAFLGRRFKLAPAIAAAVAGHAFAAGGAR